LPLSVVGGPKNGAGDEVKVGTRGLLSEGYFPILEHGHGITDPPRPIRQRRAPGGIANLAGSAFRTLAGCQFHDMDGVADHVGRTLLALGASG